MLLNRSGEYFQRPGRKEKQYKRERRQLASGAVHSSVPTPRVMARLADDMTAMSAGVARMPWARLQKRAVPRSQILTVHASVTSRLPVVSEGRQQE